MLQFLRNISLRKLVLIIFLAGNILTFISFFIFMFFMGEYSEEISLLKNCKKQVSEIDLLVHHQIINKEDQNQLIFSHLQDVEIIVHNLEYGDVTSKYSEDKLNVISDKFEFQFFNMKESLSNYTNLVKKISKEDFLLSIRINSQTDSLSKIEINSIIEKKLKRLQESSTHFDETTENLIIRIIREQHHRQKMLKFTLFAIVLIWVFFSYYGYKVIAVLFLNPIKLASQDMKIITMGDYTKKIDFNTDNELSSLFGLINSLVSKINNISSLVNEFGKGNIHYELQIKDKTQYESDQFLQSLQETQQRLIAAENENTIRLWTNEGFTVFSEILRKNTNNLDKLGRELVAELCHYLHIEVAGIFIANEDESGAQYLDLLSSYAYDSERKIQKRIDVGVTIVGEVWLEGKTRYLTDLPKGYLKIVSGLGDQDAQSILVVPLSVSKITYGVLELGSFSTFKEHEIQFIERLADNIASTISIANITQETQDLYEKSQSTTDQLKQKEEEMKRNVDEMQLGKKILLEKQNDLVSENKHFIDRIDILKDQLDSVERTKEKYIEVLNERDGVILSLKKEIRTLKRNYLKNDDQ